MIDVTGIELGPDCCVLVRAGSDPSRTTVTAARAVTPSEWSDDHDALIGVLRAAKRTNRLSSHARVVAWGLSESGSDADLAHLPELGPLVAAGFEIDGIVSPIRALADLVRSRRPAADGEAVAALSLNNHGAAIAIVCGGEVIASRVFEWPLGRPFEGPRSEIFERYLLVSQIAPELRHLIDHAASVHAAPITSVLACGNLPNLRSLSMLLIEEMDLEVETLDSADLLDAEGAGRLVDLVPTLQLAALAASSRDERTLASGNHASGDTTVVTGRPSRKAPTAPYANRDSRARSALIPLASAAAMVLMATWSVLAIAGSSPATPVFPAGLEIAAATAPAVPDIPTEATMGRVGTEGAGGGARDSGFGARLEPASYSSVPVRPETRYPSPEVRAPNPESRAPVVQGIMIFGERRLALVDGILVAPGDRVGPQVVSRIERNGVVLRDGSGQETLVAIRIRKNAE